MKTHLYLIAFLLLVSCEKDKISFEFNPLDPASGEEVIILDSVKTFTSGSSKNNVGYYHFYRNRIHAINNAIYIGVYRNGGMQSNFLLPATDTHYFYDYNVPTGDYAYRVTFLDTEKSPAKLSNEISIHVP